MYYVLLCLCCRHFYYLQLKGQILEGSLSCEKDTAVLLASYSVQGDKNSILISYVSHPFYFSNACCFSLHNSKHFEKLFNMFTVVDSCFGWKKIAKGRQASRASTPPSIAKYLDLPLVYMVFSYVITIVNF